jgi:hypothetical protein
MMKEKLYFAKWIMLLLYVSYAAGTSFFTHKTVIDGVVYIHSHPFKPGERYTHEHCKNQLQLLEQFYQTAITSDIVPNIDLSDRSPAIALFYSDIRKISHLTGTTDNRQSRAPPILMV